MRRLAISLFLIASLLPTPARADNIPSEFTFAGAGWGHGVGMSQYGALGMARSGKTEQEILQYFYPTTTVAAVKDDAVIRVNLLFQTLKATIRLSGAPGALMQIYAGDNPALDAAPLATVTGTQTLNLALDGESLSPSITSTDISTRVPVGTAFTIRWSGTRYLPGVDAWARVGTTAAAPLYRYGQLIAAVTKVGTSYAFNLSNDVRIHDEYLRGIAEMPSSWPPSALRAQAIVSRTYAVTKYGSGKLNSSCLCHVYDSQKDQRFVGYDKEAEANWGAKWVSAVADTDVDDTNGLVVTNGGKPITSYFFSSSGGRTQEISEVWGGKAPWLISVPDPWSLDPTINPTYASWVRTVPQSVVAKAFNLPDVVSVTFPTRTVAGAIKSAMAVSSTGQVATLTGEIFRSRTKLPSTFLGRSVARLTADDAASLAVTMAKIGQPTATGAVLADDGTSDIITAVAGASFAGSVNQPLFFLSAKKIPVATMAELKARKIKSVTIVGTKAIAPDSIIATLKKSGIKAVRLASTSYTATASLVAKSRTGDPILVSSQDPELAAALVGIARRDDRPLFVVSPVGPTPTLLAALRSMNSRTLTVVGRVTSIPDAWVEKLRGVLTINDQRGSDQSLLAATIADDTARVLVAVTPTEALLASTLNESVLLTLPTEVSPAITQWLSSRNVAQITVIGKTLIEDGLSILKL